MSLANKGLRRRYVMLRENQRARPPRIKDPEEPSGFDDAKAERVWAAKHGTAELNYYASGRSPKQQQEWQAKQAARVAELREEIGL